MSVAPASPPSLADAPGGARGPVEDASAGAPRPEACPLCGAPLGTEQEWCLHCGAAARTRLATSSNWKAPIIAIATVAVLSLGVLAVSLAALAGDFGSSSTAPAIIPAPVASTPAAVPTTPEGSTPGTSSPGTASSTYPGLAHGPLSTEPTVTPPTGPPPSKTQIREIVTGTGMEALPGDTLTVNYVGVLYSGGALFDSSWRRDKRFTFKLGTSQVISGWDEGVTGMKVGGRRELIVPASQAYGAQGLATRPVAIPPNEALVFVVDLLDVTPPAGTSPGASTSPSTSTSAGASGGHNRITEAQLHKVEEAERTATSPFKKQHDLELEERIRHGL